MSDPAASDGPSTADPVRIAFVCVQNAGRSQIAHALAERERERRGADEAVELLTGGTAPADDVHAEALAVMLDLGIDLSDRTPREITLDEIEECDIVITMGCSAGDVCPATWRGDARDWDIDDPHGRELDDVRAIRDEIETRVDALFDELEVGAHA